MYRRLVPCFLFAAILVLAAEAPWKVKPIPQWSAEDFNNVLLDSPWVKHATPQWLRDLSVAEREEGGDWEASAGHGIGFAALVGMFEPEKLEEAIARAHAKPQPAPVAVRWESALPVREAERRTGETAPPGLDPAHYAIAIYNMPTPHKLNLAAELKGIAYLRRDKKKDVKPSRVLILRKAKDDDTATIVYYFPRSAEISKRDGWLVFAAQVGRLFVSQNFYAGDMQIREDLEL